MIRRACIPLLTFMMILPQAYGQLQIEGGKNFDFGKIYRTDRLLKKDFVITNAGKEVIRIKEVRTSCGCTAASLSDSVLAPETNSRLEVTFNPSGYSGRVTKYIYIINSHPLHSLVTIRLTGDVAPVIETTPGYFLFANKTRETGDTARVTLKNKSGRTIRLIKAESEYKEIVFRLGKRTLKPEESCVIEAVLTKPDSGSLDGYVRIATTSSLEPVVQIRLFAGILGF